MSEKLPVTHTYIHRDTYPRKKFYWVTLLTQSGILLLFDVFPNV